MARLALRMVHLSLFFQTSDNSKKRAARQILHLPTNMKPVHFVVQTFMLEIIPEVLASENPVVSNNTDIGHEGELAPFPLTNVKCYHHSFS